jgi:hypothetical protein
MPSLPSQFAVQLSRTGDKNCRVPRAAFSDTDIELAPGNSLDGFHHRTYRISPTVADIIYPQTQFRKEAQSQDMCLRNIQNVHEISDARAV